MIQNLERRDSDYASIESQRELESQRRQLLETSQCADLAQREGIHLCSELEMKDHFHQESYARRVTLSCVCPRCHRYQLEDEMPRQDMGRSSALGSVRSVGTSTTGEIRIESWSYKWYGPPRSNSFPRARWSTWSI